jgi:hypothetical protein
MTVEYNEALQTSRCCKDYGFETMGAKRYQHRGSVNQVAWAASGTDGWRARDRFWWRTPERSGLTTELCTLRSTATLPLHTGLEAAGSLHGGHTETPWWTSWPAHSSQLSWKSWCSQSTGFDGKQVLLGKARLIQQMEISSIMGTASGVQEQAFEKVGLIL